MAALAKPGNRYEKDFLEEADKIVFFTKNQAEKILDSLTCINPEIEGAVERKFLSQDRDFSFWEESLKVFPSFRNEIFLKMIEKSATVEQSFVPLRTECMGTLVYVTAFSKSLDLASKPAGLKILVAASDKIPPGTSWFFQVWRKAIDLSDQMSTEEAEFFYEMATGKETKKHFSALLKAKQSSGR